ncbi:ABC transporter ATP-binding protein [Halobium salinum]|uniref:ABC transporter ATP-binding protein n=1 Tax=Halobium salinum TaxID=1364940 RepID=A0ABD5PDE7_9EURY|nr:ABC transporter ATP-binding protein [Halobium salinum]
MSESRPISRRRKLEALRRVAAYRPAVTAGIVLLSIAAAFFEGVGIGFLVPMIDLASGGELGSAGGIVGAFERVYTTIGVPFTIETVILGVAGAISVRYLLSFLVDWLKFALRTWYIQSLREAAFDGALDARVAYFDERGSDEVLNTIITESQYAGRVIRDVVTVVRESFITLVYLGVALYVSPELTLVTMGVLVVGVFGMRHLFESGSSVGERVADANRELQRVVQAGTQGIREVKLFGMRGDVRSSFDEAVSNFTSSNIRLRRNEVAIKNAYNLVAALTVFVLAYLALAVANLNFANLGIFLFAMFRLAPRASSLNNLVYKVDGNLPHLVGIQEFTEELRGREEPDGDGTSAPDPIDEVRFDDVDFSYGDDTVLDGLSFDVSRGEFVAFVGPSGAGKSTVAALLSRFYEPTGGAILADDVPVSGIDVDEWRESVSVVRQDPHVFSDTLRYNVMVGNPDATEEAFERVCRVASVDEFAEQLPDGYDTELGDDGVRLSGGQRQRVAIARALLKDADVLVLDEATSELDTALEAKVHAGIEELGDDRALVVIAHRLSTVRNADRIHYLEDGRLVETGPHAELLDADGAYANLYRRQARPEGEGPSVADGVTSD